jgi:uncharacterized protein (DUF697 family)
MDNVARGEKARRIAHNYVGWAVGAGLIPFPLVDIGSLVVLQVKMLTEIAELYEVPLERERARTLVMSTVGSVTSQGIALAGIPALLKFVPVLGTLLGIAIMPAAAATSTLAMAEIFIRHIETHGRLPDRAWPQLTDSQGTSSESPPAPPSVSATTTPPAAAFAVNEPVVPQPATSEPIETEEPAVTGEPTALEEPDVTAPAADAEAVGNRSSDGRSTDSTAAITTADEHDTESKPEEPGDDVVPPDPTHGTGAAQPVRRRRATAHTRRRSSPTEKS